MLKMMNNEMPSTNDCHEYSNGMEQIREIFVDDRLTKKDSAHRRVLFTCYLLLSPHSSSSLFMLDSNCLFTLTMIY